MKPVFSATIRCLRLSLGLLLFPLLAEAEIQPLAHYRMGDDEPGALASGAISSATDNLGGPALPAVGVPLFTGQVSPEAATTCNSTLAAELDGGFQAFYMPDAPTWPLDNFGWELWVKPVMEVEGFSLIAYRGDTRTDGYGIYQNGSSFGVSYGGVGRFGEAPAQLNEWIHLALVVQNGHSTFYANGEFAGEADLPLIPPSGGFALGAHPQPPLGEHFAGALDEFRMFTFEPGRFRLEDLLLSLPAKSLPAHGTTSISSWVTGTVTTGGEPTQAWFEWGSNRLMPEKSTPQLLSGSPTRLVVETLLENLSPDTQYFYRLTVSNRFGLIRTPGLTFHTRAAILSLANDGPGSLRQRLLEAEAGEEIEIAVPGTIKLDGTPLTISRSVNLISHFPLTLDGEGRSRVLEIVPGATVRLSNFTIRGGRAPNGTSSGGTFGGAGTIGGHGGGVHNLGELTLYRCIVEENQAGEGGLPSNTFLQSYFPGAGGFGGGIFNQGRLTLEECLIRNNDAGRGGASTARATSSNIPGAIGGSGGGTWNDGALHAIRTSWVGNQAGNGGAGGEQPRTAGGNGGSGGGLGNAGECSLEQCTFSGNQAGLGTAPEGTSGEGGAVFNSQRIDITACTIVSNWTQNPLLTGGLRTTSPFTNAIIRSSILAGNGEGTDIAGAFRSAGFNLLGSVIDAEAERILLPNDLVGTPQNRINPRLGPLVADNAFCWTHALTSGSPAIDAGDDALTNPPYSLTLDACRQPRRSGAAVDIGAREIDAADAVLLAATLDAEINPNADPIRGSWSVQLRGRGRVAGIATTFLFQFGATPQYGLVLVPPNNTAVALDRVLEASVDGLVAGHAYHYRLMASNELGIVYGTDRSFTIPGAQGGSADQNGDGLIDAAELRVVLASYWGAKPWLELTNVAGLGQEQVTFELPGLMSSPFVVEASADLQRWEAVGIARPRFDFTDTHAPALPQRYYRLQMP